MSVTAPPAQGLLERTEALIPMLRDSALETEKARHVLPENLEAIAGAGVFRMTAPMRFGGYESDLQTQCDVLAAIARGCPSTSWVCTIYTALIWTAATFPEEVQEEIFSIPDVKVSCVFNLLAGQATRKDGGIIANGRWPFNTGCHGAEWAIMTGLLEPKADGEEPEPIAFALPTSDLTIVDDWYATGMAGTGSNSTVAEDVFVPDHRVVPLSSLMDGNYPSNRHNADNPYFNYPLAPLLIVNAGGTPLGIAQGALELFLERLPGRQITYTSYTSQAEAPVTHLRVGEASLKIDSCASHISRACATLDDDPGRQLSMEERVEARTRIAYATQLAREAVDQLFYGSGATSIQETVHIQRFQRDMQALANHGLMHSATATELYGRILCGLEPNTPIF
jgi:alkylation response protein AidB-like acyl-CoA dehydrogenase